jgi:hypothetical protein
VKQRLIFLLAGFVLLVSCSSDNDPVKPDEDFLPLRVGAYQIYSVEETIFELGVESTRNYQLKTLVSDSFLTAEQELVYVIHRSTRETADDPWIPEETWSARRTENEVIVSEGSTPYVVLAFPLYNGRYWNGNKYNNETNPNTNTGEDTYRVISSGESYSVNNNTFGECVIVEQEDNQEFIVFNDKRIEVYARNVGLVYKEFVQLKYCNDEDRNCVGQQIVDDGIKYYQEIVEYGME